MNTVYLIVDEDPSIMPFRYSLNDGDFTSMTRFDYLSRWDAERVFKNPDNKFVFVGGPGHARNLESLEKVLRKYFSFPETPFNRVVTKNDRVEYKLIWPESNDRHLELKLDKNDVVIHIRRHGVSPFVEKEVVSVYDMISFVRAEVKEEKLPLWAREKLDKYLQTTVDRNYHVIHSLQISDNEWAAVIGINEYLQFPWNFDGDWEYSTMLCLVTRDGVRHIWTMHDGFSSMDEDEEEFQMHLSRTGKSLVVKNIDQPNDRIVFHLKDYRNK